MSDDDTLTSTAHLAAPIERVWDVLVHPARHAEADASGMVVGAQTRGAIASVGQVFAMDMVYRRSDGTEHRYATENHVTAFEPLRAIAWRTASPGKPPYGWEWRYDLRPAGDGGTDATLTQDYADCSPENRERFGLPGLWSEDDFQRSLRRLEAAAGGRA